MIGKKKKKKKVLVRHVQFSKIITCVFASAMLPISAYVIFKCLEIAKLAVLNGFSGALPYVTAIVGFVEASVTLVLGFYFDNSKKEKIARAKYGKYNTSADDRDF